MPAGFRGLLELFGWPGVPGTPEAPGVPESTYERTDVVIGWYDHEWNFLGFVEHKDGRLKKWDSGQLNLQFTTAFEQDLMQTEVTRAGDTKTVYAWGAEGEHHLMVYIRGRLEAECTVVVMEDEETEGNTADDLPVIDVRVEAWGDAQAYLSRRDVKGAGGGRYSILNETADDCIANLINANCKDFGGLIEPAEYAALGTGGVERHNFGTAKVEATSATAHPDVLARLRWDNGDSLYDAVAEQCRRYNCRLAPTWDKVASPPVLTVDVVYPREENDRTDTVKFSRENRGLKSCPRTSDINRSANVAEVRGKGTRQNQPRGYAIQQEHYDTNGLVETGETWASADSTDAQQEAEILMSIDGGLVHTYRPHIVEADGLTWGDDFEFDKVRIDDGVRAVVLEDWITAVEFLFPGPKQLDVVLTVGREEQNEDQKGQRSGGGGSGARRAGQRPKPKSGEPSGARRIICDSGEVVFDEAEEDLTLHGENNDRIRARTVATDDGSEEETDEDIQVQVGATFFAGCPPCNGYVKTVDVVTGNEVWLLARDTGTPVSPPWLGGGG